MPANSAPKGPAGAKTDAQPAAQAAFVPAFVAAEASAPEQEAKELGPDGRPELIVVGKQLQRQRTGTAAQEKGVLPGSP
jgi:hypothetical protein